MKQKIDKEIVSIAQRLYPDITTEELELLFKTIGPNAKTNASILVEYAIGRHRSTMRAQEMAPVLNSLMDMRFNHGYKVVVLPKEKFSERLIIDVCLEVYECNYDTLISRSRQLPYPDCIKTISAILSEVYGMSHTRVAQLVNRDRSTISTRIVEHNNHLRFDRKYRDLYYKCITMISNKIGV